MSDPRRGGVPASEKHKFASWDAINSRLATLKEKDFDTDEEDFWVNAVIDKLDEEGWKGVYDENLEDSVKNKEEGDVITVVELPAYVNRTVPIASYERQKWMDGRQQAPGPEFKTTVYVLKDGKWEREED